MRGHGLMQAIARVNRVFRDKPGGLVVDYLGLAHELKQALATYTESGGTGMRIVTRKPSGTSSRSGTCNMDSSDRLHALAKAKSRSARSRMPRRLSGACFTMSSPRHHAMKASTSVW